MENDILTTKGVDNNELVQYMPRLKPVEVAKALMFAICSEPDVLVNGGGWAYCVTHSYAPYDLCWCCSVRRSKISC